MFISTSYWKVGFGTSSKRQQSSKRSSPCTHQGWYQNFIKRGMRAVFAV